MKKMNDITSTATQRIDAAHDYVTNHIRKVLIKAGIPLEIAQKYSANYCHGGEWILDDDNGLAETDFHLMDNEELVNTVKEIEQSLK